jgi:hypothetical protein
MVRVNRLIALASLALASASMSGCATMYHRGNGLRSTQVEDGKRVGTLAMNLDHASADLQIYEGNQALQISQVRDHIFSNAVGNSVNRTVASGSCSGRTTPCTYSWTETSQFGPGLFLDPHRPHTLRLVRQGQEATVTVKTVWKAKWWFYDMALFMFAPVGWVVDGATGSWNQFPRLDIDRAFRNASTTATTRGSK